jgi:predicted HTH domain antitoxin
MQPRAACGQCRSRTATEYGVKSPPRLDASDRPASARYAHERTMSTVGWLYKGCMKIEIPDELAQKCGISEREALELLVIAIYRTRGIHGTLAGKMLGISELEFHSLLSKHGETVNYGMQDIIDDIKNNDL